MNILDRLQADGFLDHAEAARAFNGLAVPGKVCIVPKIPFCDICAASGEGMMEPGMFDGASNGPSWAHMCEKHWIVMGRGLGVGRGQLWIEKQ